MQIPGKVTEEGQATFLTNCPPCQAPVPTPCLGGHTTKALPCFSAAPFSCGATCQQRLACGNHTCSKTCHALLQADASTRQQGMLTVVLPLIGL